MGANQAGITGATYVLPTSPKHTFPELVSGVSETTIINNSLVAIDSINIQNINEISTISLYNDSALSPGSSFQSYYYGTTSLNTIANPTLGWNPLPVVQGMVWPSTAGIPYWSSGTSWAGAYSASNTIPFNYLNLSGTAAGLTSGACSGNAATATNLAGAVTLPTGCAATNFTLTTPVLGTPQSGNLTNCTAKFTTILANDENSKDAVWALMTPTGTSVDGFNALHGKVVATSYTPTNGQAFTSIWGSAFSPTAKTSDGSSYDYQTIGMELNVYQNITRTTSSDYVADPFDVPADHAVAIGALLNNFGSAVGSGNYIDDFGIAILCETYSSGEVRQWGYQTGLYITDTYQEMIRLSGGIRGGSGTPSAYGIKFEGQACSIAGIALGNNIFNWGGFSGSLANNGDMLYNSTSGIVYMQDTGGQKEILKTPSSVGASVLNTVTNKISVSIAGNAYYLLASTSAL